MLHLINLRTVRGIVKTTRDVVERISTTLKLMQKMMRRQRTLVQVLTILAPHRMEIWVLSKRKKRSKMRI